MQKIANFVYAGTGKYISHAVENNSTLCGMDVDELFAREGQEWEYISEEEYLNVTHKHMVCDVGCLKCTRLLTKRALDKGYSASQISSLTLEVLSTQEAESQTALCK